MTNGTPPHGWLLYDDACDFCRSWVPFWGPTLTRAGYGWEPLQSPRVREDLKRQEAELIREFRLLRTDGTSLSGADAYRDVMKRVWWTTPIYIFSIFPGGRQIFNWLYRIIRDNRYLISKHCRLPD